MYEVGPLRSISPAMFSPPLCRDKDPNSSPNWQAAWGNYCNRKERWVEELKHFRRAMALKPISIALMNNVAWVLATHPDQDVRRAEEALHVAQRAANETGQANPVVLDTLAAAYANANQYDLTISTARSALELLTTPGQEALKKKILGRLSLYEQEQAYRESDIH
jgi:tetratricopeptide (TPR) repeat protein